MEKMLPLLKVVVVCFVLLKVVCIVEGGCLCSAAFLVQLLGPAKGLLGHSGSANGPCQRALGHFLVHLVGLAKGLLEKQLALHMGSWALEKGSWRGRGLETKKVCVCVHCLAFLGHCGLNCGEVIWSHMMSHDIEKCHMTQKHVI